MAFSSLFYATLTHVLSRDLHRYWSFPLRIAFTVFLLARWVGLAALAPVALSVLAVPLNVLVLRRIKAAGEDVMEEQDRRMTRTAEAVDTIATIKVNCFEPHAAAAIAAHRRDELTQIRRSNIYTGVLSFLLMQLDVLLALSTFAAYAWLGGDLTVEVVFPCLLLFDALRWPILSLPMAAVKMINALASAKRVQRFLNMPVPVTVRHGGAPSVTMEAAEFRWPSFDWSAFDRNNNSKSDDAESDVQLTAPTAALPLGPWTLQLTRPGLYAVAGRVGAGKTSLLNALLGELVCVSGRVDVCGRVAYVPQTAYVMNASVKENILYGLPNDERHYRDAVARSCLAADVALFPQGDDTELGERGVTLSGGQKARVSLARALFCLYTQGPHLLLLDDPLSALDAQVGRRVFVDAIAPLREQGHIVVLVTHARHVLPACDAVFEMVAGQLQPVERVASLDPKGKLDVEAVTENDLTATTATTTSPPQDVPAIKLTQMERDADSDGHEVRLSQLMAQLRLYLNGPFVALAYTVLTLSAQLVPWLVPWWLSLWTADAVARPLAVWLGVYGALVGAMEVAAALRTFLWAHRCTAASGAIHADMLHALLHAPLSYFNRTPSGRILARFSSDLSSFDTVFGALVHGLFSDGTSIAFALFFCAVLSPISLLPTAIAVGMFVKYVNFARPSIREAGRIKAAASSPMYSYFGELLNGVVTVRAYDKAAHVTAGYRHRMQRAVAADFHQMAIDRWLSVRTNGISGALQAVVVVCGIALGQPIVATVLAMTYATACAEAASGLLQTLAQLQGKYGSVERLLDMAKLPPERAVEAAPVELATGRVVFDNVWLRYAQADEQCYALQGVTFALRHGERVGVVGRTGAGKSSLLMALLDLVRAERGEILVDGLSVDAIPLATLRTSVACVPQEPVIFAATLRANVDVFARHSDAALWQALHALGLQDYLRHRTLDSLIDSNMSVGEKQIIALARVYVSRCKVLVLDESTASVDPATDELIQRAIRVSFRDCTIICIAHRLQTIRDFDRVIVMDAGRVVEMGPPDELLRAGGAFARLHDASTGLDH